jgi:hypothetical protein
MSDKPAENQDEFQFSVSVSGEALADEARLRVEQALAEAVDRELATPALARGRRIVRFSRTQR